jgi:hypothetical protein
MRTIQRPGKVVLGIAIASSMIAAACTSESSSGAPNDQSSVTPATTSSASSPPLVQEGGAPLGPGTYTTVFQPKITFTTDASWVSDADTRDFVWFERSGEYGLSGNGGIGFKRIDKVLDPTRAHKLMPVPKDYVAWIVSLPGVKVLAGPKAVTVDGVAATEIDVTATMDAPTVYCKDPCVALWPLGRNADFQGQFMGLDPDSVRRLVVIRLNGETVEMSGSSGGAGFTAIAKDFDAIIQSVHFG